MNELEEINEDNCVLDELDIKHIEHVYQIFLKRFEGSDIEHDWEENFISIRNRMRELLLKINKLNDMAKERKTMRDPEFAEVFEAVDEKILNEKLNNVVHKNELEIMKASKERYRLIRETMEDVIELIIEKARNFPDYPVSELKKELRSWLGIVDGL